MTLQMRAAARELYEEYFKAAEAKPRGVVYKLRAIVQQLESAFACQLSQIKVRDYKCIEGWLVLFYLPATTGLPDFSQLTEIP